MEAPRDSGAVDRSLVSGIAWTAMLRWAAQLVSWVAMLYVARILAPGDFGLVAMAMLAIGLSRLVQELGLDAILVQDRGLVGAARAELAGFLIGFGMLLCALYLLAAPLVAAFFGEPQVAAIVMALSILFLFDCVQVVPAAQLQRELQFRRLAIVAFAQVTTTSAALVAAATLGLGTWSLVVNQLAGEAAATILLLSWAPYAIARPRNLRALARPLLQGWRMLASRIAWYGYTNADQAIVGKVLGKELLGAYSFALTFSAIPQKEIGSVISKVAPGIFSEVQDRPDQLRRYFLLLTEFFTLIAFPAAFGLALVADLLVPLALGEQWHAVVAPLRWLCVFAAFYASQMMLSHVLLWTGQFRINMWCSVLGAVSIPVALLFAVQNGLEAVAIAWVVVFPLADLPAFYFAFRTIRIGLRDWAGAIAPALAASALMAAGVALARMIVPADWPPAARVAAAVATGAMAYPAALALLFRARMAAMIRFASSLRSR
ncbi:MAG: lipopolysaccharide biosynthesis protein [Gammaproteobacteria bacterium]